MHAIVHAADVQDRNGGLLLLATLFGKFPFLEKLFADSAYQGRRTLLQFAGAAAAAPTFSRVATAQVYLSRPITMIVPVAAGGPTDVVGRG
jgi:hypothetical protein